MERVSTFHGSKPVIIVAPHGCDDTNTQELAEKIIETGDYYGIINRGFYRADSPDPDNDFADCNRVDQATTDFVVKSEFFEPIDKFVNKLTRNWSPFSSKPLKGDKALILWIHGCSDHVHKLAGEDVQVIIGWGNAIKKPSPSCEEWQMNLFGDSMNQYSLDGKVYQGAAGGKFAGRAANNMNQYYRKHDYNPSVASMQLEFPFTTRKDGMQAYVTGMMVSCAIEEYLAHDAYTDGVQFPSI